MNRLGLFLFLLVSPAIACGAPGVPAGERTTAGGDAASAGSFVSLSDIHFDPFYDAALFGDLMATDASGWRAIFERSTVTELAPAGADSNYNLLHSALQAARIIGRDADFVVVSGDFLAHGFQDSFRSALAALPVEPAAGPGDCRTGAVEAMECFIDRTIEFVALMLRDSFAETPIYPALGNNDSYCGDYEIDPLGPFVARTGATWSRLLIDAPNRARFEQTFGEGGYYAVASGDAGTTIVVLNSNLFSSHYRDACAIRDVRAYPPLQLRARSTAGAVPGGEAARGGATPRPAGVAAPAVAAAQLRWLEQQLQRAQADRSGVLLLYHIPVGTDVYATLKHGSVTSAAGLVRFWSGDYSAAFLDVVARDAAAIRAILVGHTHMDQYVLVPRGGTAVAFEHVTPAISPMFGNNPAFERVWFERDSGVLLDYETHILPVAGAADGASPAWQEEYRFSAVYGEPRLSAATLGGLWLRQGGEGADRARFERYFTAGNAAETPFTGSSWEPYWCGLGTATAADFIACMQRAARAAR